jgi:hypothetical protein
MSQIGLLPALGFTSRAKAPREANAPTAVTAAAALKKSLLEVFDIGHLFFDFSYYTKNQCENDSQKMGYDKRKRLKNMIQYQT